MRPSFRATPTQSTRSRPCCCGYSHVVTIRPQTAIDRRSTMSDQGIGASVRRKEDFRFLTGAGNYTDDINRPGQLYAYILRSPHAHAEINGIDSRNASAAPGVIAVFTGAADIALYPVANFSHSGPTARLRGSRIREGPHEISTLTRSRPH